MAHRIAVPSSKVVNAVAHLVPRAALLLTYLLAAIAAHPAADRRRPQCCIDGSPRAPHRRAPTPECRLYEDARRRRQWESTRWRNPAAAAAVRCKRDWPDPECALRRRRGPATPSTAWSTRRPGRKTT